MRKVFLVTGFNNWGKTSIISSLFGVKAFKKRSAQWIDETPFMVLPMSNDDLGRKRYEDEYNSRLESYEEGNGLAKFIVSAFCPTRESTNDSLEIIRNIYSESKVHIILIEHKWCGHARLNIDDIASYYKTERNVLVHSIVEKSASGKIGAIKSYIQEQCFKLAE